MYRSRGNGYRSRGGGGRNTRHSAQRGLFVDGVWHCDCNPRLPAPYHKVKKDSPNKGRMFYSCQQDDANRCGFFLWDDDAKVREESAVLNGKRTEPRRSDVQEGWNAGREVDEPQGKGLFTRTTGPQEVKRNNGSTASASPPPYSTAPPTNSVKRTAQDAEFDIDDDYGDISFDGVDAEQLANNAGAFAPQTPFKTQKTGVYATPATTGKRRLPWLEAPTTPAAAAKTTDDYFDTPSKPAVDQAAPPETPFAPPTPATAASPSPPTRFKDALSNPADSSSSLTSEVLAALSSTPIAPAVIQNVRSILTTHDLRTQGVKKGRDVSRLAIKAKDAKIAELHARIASLEAERELEREMRRQVQSDKG